MNNRWRSLLCVLLIAVVTGCTLLIPKSAYAWKTKTHGYSANLLLKDAKDGKLKIDGTDYAMPAEYKTALEKYPQSFRAGVLGPDFYPDMLTASWPPSLQFSRSTPDCVENELASTVEAEPLTRTICEDLLSTLPVLSVT